MVCEHGKMSIELKMVGVTVYSVIVFLAIIWGAVGFSYFRAGKQRLMWGSLATAMFAFALLFFGLSVIAAEPWWLNRMVITIVNRTLGMVAMLASCSFTWQYLHREWRRSKAATGDGRAKFLGQQ